MKKSSAKPFCKFCFAVIELKHLYTGNYTTEGYEIIGPLCWTTDRGLVNCLQPDPAGTITNALGQHFSFKDHVPDARAVAKSLDELIRLS